MSETLSPRIGTWLSVGSPVIAELAGMCGFDWVLIDLEHGCESEAALPDQLRALRGGPTEPIVRVGAPHPDLIARVLDWGARGFMVPRVSCAAEAEAIVRAAHYAPRGQRGYSRTVRAHAYGLLPADAAPAPIIMAQIETIAGVNHAAEIARVDGIDVLFIGPADLQLDLRHHAAAAPGDFARCRDIVLAAARDSGKGAGILLRETADLRAHLDMGFNRIAVDSDLSILRKAYAQILGRTKMGESVG